MGQEIEYLLEGDQDRSRIDRQNRGRPRREGGRDYGKASWGLRHMEYMSLLWLQGVNPLEIAEIGVADDARLVETEFYTFPYAHITIFERSIDRLQAAEKRLIAEIGEDEVRSRITFVHGDAAKTIPQQNKKFGLVTYQLLDEHLTEEQLAGILHATAQNLEPNGILATADLEFGSLSWSVLPVEGHEDEPSNLPEYANLAEEVNATIQLIREQVYKKNGRHDWESAQAHADAIRRLSGNQFNFAPSLSRPPHYIEFSGTDLEVELMENITGIFSDNAPELKDRIATYINALREGKLIGRYPALFQQSFTLGDHAFAENMYAM